MKTHSDSKGFPVEIVDGRIKMPQRTPFICPPIEPDESVMKEPSNKKDVCDVLLKGSSKFRINMSKTKDK